MAEANVELLVQCFVCNNCGVAWKCVLGSCCVQQKCQTIGAPNQRWPQPLRIQFDIQVGPLVPKVIGF